MAPTKQPEALEIRALLKEYVGAAKSDPPPSNTAELETRLVEMLVDKYESLDRMRHNLASQLGTSIRDSGTFEPFSQTQLDLVMLRTANQRLTQEVIDLKAIIKTWTDRKNEWLGKVALGMLGAVAYYIWSQLTGKK